MLSDLRGERAAPTPVEVPGWTAPVFLRRLPAWDLVRIADQYPDDADERARQFALIEATLVDMDGAPVLGEGEARLLDDREFSAITAAMREDEDPGN